MVGSPTWAKVVVLGTLYVVASSAFVHFIEK